MYKRKIKARSRNHCWSGNSK